MSDTTMRYGLALALAAFAGGGVPMTAQAPRKIIDAHAHADMTRFADVVATYRAQGVVVAVVGGDRAAVSDWSRLAKAAGIRVLSGFTTGTELLGLSAASLDAMFADGAFGFVGELATQYVGVPPNDIMLDALFGWAAQRGLPVGIHMGLTAPGIALGRRPAYRVSLGNPLLLEDVLVRHPKLRLWVMHAGNPFLAEMIGLLHAFPSVYVDLSATGCQTPVSDPTRCPMRALVERGFEDRLMFGTDVFNDPSVIGRSIEYVESAEFLTPVQKEKILCRNAARFFQLPDVCGPDR